MTIKRKTLGSRLDAAVSLLAGGSAAFVLFAMPEALLGRAFAAAGLASFSPKLQPPLGAEVRFGVVAAAGLLILAFTWSLMKALDRGPAHAAPPQPVALPKAEPEAPRLRKADAHPDAPSRRPLLAGRDLGEPLELEAPVQMAAADEAEEAAEELVLGPEPAPAALAPDPLPPFLVAQPQESQEPPAAQEPQEPPAPQGTQEPQEWQAPATTADAAPALEREPASDDSISSLMRRFETGLGRKKQALPERGFADPESESESAPPSLPSPPLSDPLSEKAEAKPEPVTGPAPVGHRLRSAIADLQRVSGR